MAWASGGGLAGVKIWPGARWLAKEHDALSRVFAQRAQDWVDLSQCWDDSWLATTIKELEGYFVFV